MSKHTPGPWDYDQDDLAIWINATAAGYPEPIAKMGKSARLPQYANAKLIAAAPDLLEALEGMMDEYRWIGGDAQESSIANNAERTIAKARGETND